MRARSSCPHRAQRQRSGRGQRTPKPWPSWWRSYPVISTPGGKSTSIVTLATVSVLLGRGGRSECRPQRPPGGQTGMITQEGHLAKRQENPRPRTLKRKSPAGASSDQGSGLTTPGGRGAGGLDLGGIPPADGRAAAPA